MGMFDSVKIDCPSCGATVEFQSKAGRCNLDEFSDEDVPLVIALDIVGDVETCVHCNKEFKIKFGIPMPKEVDMVLREV